jgi:hypothetical protein
MLLPKMSRYYAGARGGQTRFFDKLAAKRLLAAEKIDMHDPT